MICADDLFYEKILSNATSLMGSILWIPTLNLHIQGYLLIFTIKMNHSP